MTGKVLVVDDSEMARNLCSGILYELGYEVDTAENGMEALEKVAEGEFCSVLVDLNMPVMDGYTFVMKLREIEKLEDLPVIIVTTEGEAKDRERGYEVGADVYIVKPLKKQELEEHLNMLLAS
tara:strand:+ start:643 stop:1011 length:369 start_codon:yes stop_codon:yes gene_type:complete